MNDCHAKNAMIHHAYTAGSGMRRVAATADYSATAASDTPAFSTCKQSHAG